jgi:hypothetical protein
MLKFKIMLHQLTPNAIVQLSKFFWAVVSFSDRPTAEVFAKYYELHYQQKKVKKGEETLNAQFGCITFHPNRYGDGAKFMPVVKNNSSAGWARSWFYCKVPIHQSEAGGKGIHLLHSRMSSLDYLTEPVHNCPEDDVNDKAFVHATTTIGGRDAVEEFLAYKMWPLSSAVDLSEVEEAESPLLKAAKAAKEKDSEFVSRISVCADRL